MSPSNARQRLTHDVTHVTHVGRGRNVRQRGALKSLPRLAHVLHPPDGWRTAQDDA